MQWVQVVCESKAVVRMKEPYLPGFLAFREVDFLLERLREVQMKQPHSSPQVCTCICMYIYMYISIHRYNMYSVHCICMVYMYCTFALYLICPNEMAKVESVYMYMYMYMYLSHRSY